MQFNAYSLLDTKSGLYSAPWFSNHDATAFRQVAELAGDRNSTVGRYPADFVLYRVGLFNDNTADLSSIVPVNLGSVSALFAAMTQIQSKEPETLDLLRNAAE